MPRREQEIANAISNDAKPRKKILKKKNAEERIGDGQRNWENDAVPANFKDKEEEK